MSQTVCGVRWCAGVSLIEVLMVLVILGITAGIAAPSLQTMLHSSTLAADTNDLVSSLALARSEAIKTGHRVVVCKGRPETRCVRNSAGWEDGWMVFVDVDNDAQISLNTPSERLILQANGSGRHRMIGNLPVKDYVSYSPLGHTMAVNGALQMGTITVCRPAAVSGSANQLVISRTGRVRLERLQSHSCTGS